MRSLLKYITLLIIGGVIIPLYKQPVNIMHGRPCQCKIIAPAQEPATNNGGLNFYYLPDAVIKLLPLADFFK